METDLFKGVFGKLYEAFSVFLLVSVLAYIFVFATRGMLGLEHKSHSVILHWWICTTVSVLSCHVIPLGITKIFDWTQTIPLKTEEHRVAIEKVRYLERDRNVLQQKLEFHQSKLRKHMFDDLKRPGFNNSRTLVNDTTRSIFAVLKGLKSEINSIEKAYHEMQHKAKSSPIQRNFSFVIVFILSIFSWILFICTVSMSLIKGVYSINGDWSTLEQYHLLSGIHKLKDVSTWRLVETLGEFILVVYFIAAFVTGCYQIEPMRSIRPVWGNTCMKNIIANVTLMLIIGAALPTIVPILGLTKLDLIGQYPVTDYTIQNQFWLPFLYRAFVVISSSYTVLDRYVLSRLAG
ncbi:hypothetical protein K7432_013739 [Basidiobolus ranarum]|uniref:Uncharacterized protein n=1 Tax=Basidiobolus ranarum TaxID=34480 RepID=A0ABR2VQD5_9FUNG